jgi:hypothetical protein
VNEEARNVVLEHFCTTRGLRVTALADGLQDVTCAATVPYLLMIECLDQLDPTDPTGGLLAKLVDRTYGTVAGTLALVALGHRREAEILSRAALEGAVTLRYIAEKESELRLAQFFTAYVRQEREQNRKWKNDLHTIHPATQRDHLQRISQKEKALAGYENLVKQFAKHCAVDLQKLGSWPGLIERLTDLGRRIDYRTVYAAMCSQTHHDAEDILNHFIANSIETELDLSDRVEKEIDTFSIFMVLFGVKWFVEALCAVGRRLQLPTVMEQGNISLVRIDHEMFSIASALDADEFPGNWTVKSGDS